MTTQFNPAYSTVKYIFLENDTGELSFDILSKNTECQFEKAEFIESINEVFPKGAIVVRDTIDIVSFISRNGFTKVKIQYLNNSFSWHDITSTTYITNAASDTEENFVSINITNSLYKYMQKSSLLDDFPYLTPRVYIISDFVKKLATEILTKPLKPDEIEIALKFNVSDTSNYMVYKPINDSSQRIYEPSDNAVQYLNYLSTFACDKNNQKPRYMFWTNWDNQVNFQYFDENIENNPLASDQVLNDKILRFAIFNSDTPVVKLRSNNDNEYRKINYFTTDPAEQYISKNYYYIRKTPKILDTFPLNAGMTYTIEGLLYDYSDEGQRYNIEFLSSAGVSGFTAGADQLIYDSHWGPYNYLANINGKTYLTHLGEDFGTSEALYKSNILGTTGYFQYVDNPDMWKNMFDITEIHPNYPTNSALNDVSVEGKNTYLQKILDIRYKGFTADLAQKQNRLELLRQIEKQNFLMYVLCCMSKQEKSFFAKLTEYELDTTYGLGETSHGTQEQNDQTKSLYGNLKDSPTKAYRYKWVKLNFDGAYGATGPIGVSGGAQLNGSTSYYMHNIESWAEDPLIKSGNTMDDTWAINLNERSVSTKYLPSGWTKENLPQGFNWRPIGAMTSNPPGITGGIRHIVRMSMVPMSDLLLDSNQPVPTNFIGKYLYYFTAANILDGNC